MCGPGADSTCFREEVVMRLHAMVASFAVTLSLAVSATASAQVIYKLNEGSTFQFGCFAPCECPLLIEQDLRGTFTLTKLVDFGTFKKFLLTDINLRAGTGDGLHTFVGDGIYTVITEFAVQPRMQLRLTIAGAMMEEFDSGFLPGGEGNAIDTTVSINGMFCFDTVLGISAQPVGPGGVTIYSLVEGSDFTKGCFPPCECPIIQF